MNRERTNFKIGSRAQRLARMIVVLLTLTGVVAGTCLPTSLGAVEKNTTRLSAEYSGNWWETYDYTPDGSDASYIYNLYTKTTDPSKFEMGDTVIFVPSSVTAPSYSAGVPDASAILRKAEKQNGALYEETNVDFYVEVQRSAAGFDWCMGGTLNNGLTEYNCWGGAVRGLGGSTYLYQKVPFLTKITVDLKKDDESWSGKTA